MRWILVGAIVAMLAYEGWALWTRQAGDTISEIIWTLSAKRPLVPFIVGMLCGHFFWQKG